MIDEKKKDNKQSEDFAGCFLFLIVMGMLWCIMYFVWWDIIKTMFPEEDTSPQYISRIVDCHGYGTFKSIKGWEVVHQEWDFLIISWVWHAPRWLAIKLGYDTFTGEDAIHRTLCEYSNPDYSEMIDKAERYYDAVSIH